MKTNAGTACRSWTRCRWFGEAASWCTPCRGCSYSFSTHCDFCRLPFVTSQRQYQAGSQADNTRRERLTLQTMAWQFSFCSIASPLPWSTSSYLIPPSSWWPPCTVWADFRLKMFHFCRTRVQSLAMLVTNSLTDSLTHCCLINLIDVTLRCEDANSKFV